MEKSFGSVVLLEDIQTLSIGGREVDGRPPEPSLVGIFPGVLERGHDVVVPGYQPPTYRIAPVDGCLLPHSLECGVRISNEFFRHKVAFAIFMFER